MMNPRLPVPTDRSLRLLMWVVVIAVGICIVGLVSAILQVNDRLDSAAEDRHDLRSTNAVQDDTIRAQQDALDDANQRLRAAGERPVVVPPTPSLLIGPQGSQGLPGIVGPMGPRGPIGPQGDAGIVGSVGAVGPMGPAGSVGAKGDMGPAGAKGEAGPQGPAGERGPAGQDGTQGLQGEPGPLCPTGYTGQRLTVVTPEGSPGSPATAVIFACVLS